MEKLYNRIDFHNGTTPALNESNLNSMSKAIDDLDNRVIKLPAVISEESVEICVEAAKRAEEVAKSIPEDYSEVSRRAESISNRNLLDNGWFTVNQRGVTRFASGYGCDRWNAINGYFNVDDNGITFLGKDEIYHDIVLDQMLETQLEVGKEYTISVKIGDEIFSETCTFGSGAYTPIGNSGLSINRDFTNKVRLWNNNATTDITVRAVKLEKGSISTLTNDVAPNYAEELLKCQRYFVRFRANTSNHGFVLAHVNNGASLRFPLTLPCWMRSNAPAVTYGGVIKATASDSGSAVNCSGLSRVDMCANVLILQTSGTFTVGGNYMMVFADSNTYIDISADL